MIAVRAAIRIERDHEEVVSLQPPQHRQRSRRSERGVAERSTHGVQHGRAAQPCPRRRVQRLEQLRPHVVRDRRLRPCQFIGSEVLSAGGPRQAQAEVGRRRPSFGPGQKAGDLLGRDLDADRRSQRVRVRLVQCQLLRTDLQQVARRAESRVRQRQHPTRGDCQSQGRRQAEHQERDHVEWSRLVEMMRVIEHQNGRRAPRPDRLDEPWQQRRFERSTGRRQ